MELTVGELKEILRDADDDTPIMFASQPTYPMEHTVVQAEVVYPHLKGEAGEQTGGKLVLIEGEKSYMSGQMAKDIGW